MLPERFLHLEFVDEEVVPRFLSPRDAVWVRGLMQEVDAFVGRSGRELDDATGQLVHACRLAGASHMAASGVLTLLNRTWARHVLSAAKPAEIRRAVFEHAATGCTRQQALETAATDLGITAAEVSFGLFADRPSARRIVAPECAPDPQQVVEMYNLSLVQGLLARSERVAVLVRQNVRSVVRYAKLKGLLCTYTQDASGTMIELSGPLSLFRNTTKYGNALSKFFPALVVTPGWSLGATCLLRKPPWLCEQEHDVELRRYRFVLDASAPVHTTHGLPSEADSAVERRLMRDVRRLRRGWTIERETTALQVGASVFFPDFKLVRGEDQVLVEVVGFYTPEYLETKLKKLRMAKIRNLIVCVDQSLACEDEAVTADVVLRYCKRIDAAALVDAAQRLVDESVA